MTSIFAPQKGAISESELRGPQAWLLDTGGMGMSTQAGVRVSEDNVIALSAVFASARALAEDVGGLPLKVYRRLPNGGKESAARDTKYPTPDGREVNLYRLVHDEPNAEMDDLALRSLLIWWALLWGNAFAEVQRDGGGRPVAVQPVHPQRVRVIRDDQDRLLYRVRNKPGEKEGEVQPRNMIHLHGMSDDGVVGYMMAKVAKEAFGIYMAAERYTGSFFGRGATLAGILTFPQAFKTQESLEEYRRKFNEKYAGASNAHQWMLADSDAKVTLTGADPEKSQLVESLKFRIEDVARWFRVPPVIIGHNTGTPYANIEPLGQFYTKFGMRPWALRIEKEFGRKLTDDPDVFVEHVIDALMWADAKTRAEFHNAAIRGGWRNPNEVRDIENLNPIPGGDKYRVEQNLSLLDDDGMPVQVNEPAAPAAPQEGKPGAMDIETIKATTMPVFVDAAERMIDREVKAIAGRKAVTSEWLDKFCDGHRAAVSQAFAAPVATLARLAGADGKGIADRYADAHVGESRRRLASGDDMSKWLAERPAWIARHLTDEVCNETTEHS